MEKEWQIKVVKYLNCETVDVPIYEMEYMEKRSIYPWAMQGQPDLPLSWKS